MNEDIVKGNWNEMKGKIVQKWGKFTNNDVTTMKGNYQELLGAIQKKYGYEEEKAREEVDSFMKENKWLH